MIPSDNWPDDLYEAAMDRRMQEHIDYYHQMIDNMSHEEFMQYTYGTWEVEDDTTLDELSEIDQELGRYDE